MKGQGQGLSEGSLVPCRFVSVFVFKESKERMTEGTSGPVSSYIDRASQERGLGCSAFLPSSSFFYFLP